MKYIQCFPLYKPNALRRVIAYAVKDGAEILLDLEDGVSDLLNPVLNNRLKEDARKVLLALADFLLQFQTDAKLHIRVNNPGTADFYKDLNTLASLPGIKWESVFLPKTKSAACIMDAGKALSTANIAFRKISPIIETREAYNYIIKEGLPKGQNIHAVFFGNYDFNLDCGNWPIVDQDSPLYYDLIMPFAHAVESAGYAFGNSPYAKLKDLATLQEVLNRLTGNGLSDFYQVTLNAAQTKLCKNFKRENFSDKINKSAPEDSSTINELQGSFSNNRSKGRGFAFDRQSGTLITPHQYLLSVLNNSKQ